MANKDRLQVQREALAAIDDKQCAGIEVSMGVGKTRIGLKDMAANFTDYSKFLVVAPKTKIHLSWKDEIIQTKAGYLNKIITFTTYLSLSKQDYDYDVVYLDECHSLKKSHREWLTEFKNRGGRIIGLTGTYPVYMGSEKGKMCEEFCPKVYEYKVDEAVDDSILNDYEIIIHKLRLSEKRDIPKTGQHGDFYTSEKKDYDYWSGRLDDTVSPLEAERLRLTRMKLLQGFRTKLDYAKALLEEQTDKTIVFVNTKEQADEICSHAVYSGKKEADDNLEAFKKGKVTKLSAIDQLSEGVNIPNLRVGIICHAYANNRKAAQKIGRMLRLNPKDKATIHILCYENSVDKEWVESALKDFSPEKIKWVTPQLHAGVDY